MSEEEDKNSITHLIHLAQSGDGGAADELFALVYQELRKLAGHHMLNERPGITLQATSLVHEVWLKLLGNSNQFSWEDRQHFFVAAAVAMKRILVDAARARTRKKRGGNQRPQSLDQVDEIATMKDRQLIALDDALEALRVHDPVKADLVHLRYFAGMTNAEVAQHLSISTSTAERHWAFARAWLRQQMDQSDENENK